MDNNSHKDCPFGDEIVSYMYDEMAVAERPKFEQHLASCQVCTDDFAAVSVARFETYDWKRAEFDALPTPRIVIPYAEKAVPVRQWLSSWLGWAAAVPVAAALVIGLSYFVYVGGSADREPAVAQEAKTQQPETTIAPATVIPSREETPATTVAVKNTRTPKSVVRQAALKMKPSMPRTQFARSIGHSIKFNNDLAVNIPSQTKPLPRLGSNDDEDDRSLRLSDLFDETSPPQR